MEIRVLRYFLEIAREGNMSRAAERLHVTQPDVYKRQVDAPAPAPIITQSVFLIFFAALSIWSSYASFWNT